MIVWSGGQQEAEGHQGGVCPVSQGEQRGGQGHGGEGEARQSAGTVHSQS